MEKTLIRGGLLMDGGGGAPALADVLVEGAHIARIGAKLSAPGAHIVDAAGCVVCPGFIDTHRHIDAALLRQRSYGQIELRQGITSAIAGNCGFSAFPYAQGHEAELLDFLRPITGDLKAPLPSAAAFLHEVQSYQPAINVGTLLGGGTLRIALAGFAPGALSQAQLEEGQAHIRRALEEGAFGLSMGLMYAPENEYRRDQLTQLARAMEDRGVLAVHIRGEGESLVPSIEEALRIAEDAGVRLQISHFKAAGKHAWGAPYERAKALIESAIERGQDVMVDVYPYEAGSTAITTLLPPSWLRGGLSALMARLEAPKTHRELQRILGERQQDWDNLIHSVGFEGIRIAGASKPENAWLIGRDLRSAAQQRSVSEAQLICELIVSERGNVPILNFIVSEDNLKDALRLPYAFVVSDSILSGGRPHPRYHGAFAKMLREGLLPLPELVRRMSAVPAQRYAIHNRGQIKAGFHADICVFDPHRVRDLASYEHSERMAQGFECVMVNGQIAVKKDVYLGAQCGRALRRNAI